VEVKPIQSNGRQIEYQKLAEFAKRAHSTGVMIKYRKSRFQADQGMFPSFCSIIDNMSAAEGVKCNSQGC
jgi:hypothetical protein